jgi:type I restriction enzyme S subunit
MKEVKQGYKETEVGVIPEDWNLISINDMLKNSYLLEHIDGNHGELYPRNSEFIIDGIPFVGANDFKGNYVNIKKCKKLSKKRSLLFRKGFLINNDILFAHNATVGSVAIFNFKGEFGVSSTTTTCYRANNNKLNYLYLFNILKSDFFKNQYTPVMYQSTRMQVPVLTQRKFLLPLPPTLAEQEKIATALSDTDSYIEKLEKLIEKKKFIKTGAMQELLTGKKRLPGFGKGKGYKETEVGVIPEDWEVKKLGEVINGVVDNRGKTPPISKLGVPLVEVNSIYNQGKNPNLMLVSKYVSDETYITWFRSGHPKISDILIVTVGSAGHTSIMNNVKICIAQNLIALKSNENYSSSFIYGRIKFLTQHR